MEIATLPEKEKQTREQAVYKYYSTHRPVDIGTFPKTENGPTKITNFDKREDVEKGSFQAWGYLLYTAPLTEKQMGDYELRAAPSNPNQFGPSPEQMEQRIQTVGEWEKSKRIPDVRRLTWWYPDFGVFVKKEFVTDAELSDRYNKIMGTKAHVKAENRKGKGA